MVHWEVSSNSSRCPHRIFERPLGLTELGFYWDGKFKGTADTLQHAIVEVENPHLLGVHNVTRTWIALKRQFPLLGSYLSDRRDRGQVVFVVEESRLDIFGPGEITFQDISSPREAQEFVDNVVNGEGLLSDGLLARLFILARTDEKSHVHVLIHVAHCITDGIANANLLKNFLDILSSPPSHPCNIEERLALAIASEDLVPKINNTARERWYHAIGHTLALIRMEKITGGHTLPRKMTGRTLYTPARSAAVFTSFSSEESAQIMRNCRGYGITFGNAFPVLSQVALTRVLCRRYITGHITNEEWEYRKKEPMTTGGPLNLRPFLNREWFERGGSENISLSISFFLNTLPFMPLGLASGIKPGDPLPTFQSLLTPARFLLRCNITKQQTRHLIQHPRFLDIAGARARPRVDRLKAIAVQWKDWHNNAASDQAAISVKDQGVVYGPVLSHGGSSFGNVDSLLPRDYPLLREATDPRTLHLVWSQTRLHCRPAELYLGAATTRQQLHLNVYWDDNVYEEDIVNEWLMEVRDAVQFYLVLDGKSTGEVRPRL